MTEPPSNVPSPGPAPAAESVRAPRVFISYAHDSDTHRETVRDLWIFLRAHGVDARIDPGRGRAAHRLDAVDGTTGRRGRPILVVASPAYRQRAGHEADPSVGQGVQYEARLIRNLFYQDQSALGRFLPVVLPGGSTDDLPAFLSPAIATVYRVSGFTVAGAEELLRVLHGRPGEVEAPVGPVPDLPTRGHALSQAAATDATTSSKSAAAVVEPLHHQVDIDISLGEGGLTTTVFPGRSRARGTAPGVVAGGDRPLLGQPRPPRNRHPTSGPDRDRLSTALFDEPVGRRLLELVDASPGDDGRPGVPPRPAGVVAAGGAAAGPRRPAAARDDRRKIG